MNELSRNHALAKLVEALDSLYPQGLDYHTALCGEQGMPDFVTARNGQQRLFNRSAKIALMSLVCAWQKEVPRLAIRVESKELESLLRKTVADLHADGVLKASASENLRLLDDTVQKVLQQTKTDFIHSFPARTLGMEYAEPFVIGPVTVMTREQWVEVVEFSEYAKKNSLGGEEANQGWKAALLLALAKPKGCVTDDEPPMPWLAVQMYGPLGTGRSLVRVKLSGYERSLSTKAARHICKTALDGLSLILGGENHFHAQTLADERMVPVLHHTVIEQDGFLMAPGLGLSQQVPGLSGEKVKEVLDGERAFPIRDALAHILDGLVSPASHPHPLLAMRWATALDWLADGTREVSESIALTKIGTCLDVLTEGGKFGKILDMLTHLTGWKEETKFRVGADHRTLRWLVKELYDHGRSKILHGNVFDRLQTFAEVRKVGAMLARIALIECALRLKHYIGDDVHTAFRTIPEVTVDPDPEK
ncbi:hypothetical protein NAT69_19245 [Pseudomonas stutzeri]|uniref:hypothetical protein n=1 Tax=Stutzerimonas stutzeri TaxID=316 RepID=UPI00210ADD05|nr:hypothetical protein [Stutzerimonas stutzeri]MCQ4293337.1 hypothetical protein [Stutzerimonas stutzeri]